MVSPFLLILLIEVVKMMKYHFLSNSEYTIIHPKLMFPFSSNISLSDKILFFESISNLLDGGVSLIASISSFTERINNAKFKAVLQNTVYFLQSGDSLSTAMRKIPDFYTQKEIAIIESGEQTGMLKETFLSIAKDLRNQEDLRRKVANAMAYPVIILFFLILSLSIVMIYVIPQILPIIMSTGTNLGWSTRSLVATSDFLRNNILLLIGGTITMILLIN
jgi:MSHA biogenesis protein MshG